MLYGYYIATILQLPQYPTRYCNEIGYFSKKNTGGRVKPLLPCVNFPSVQCDQEVSSYLQTTSAELYLHYFRGFLVGFVISVSLTDLCFRVDSAVYSDIPSSLT